MGFQPIFAKLSLGYRTQVPDKGWTFRYLGRAHDRCPLPLRTAFSLTVTALPSLPKRRATFERLLP